MNSEIDRKIAVIFVADVVGYSKHMEKDENATIKSYNACEKLLNKLLKKYKGSVFNTAGDSVLAEFPSAVNAVECGVDFQNEINKRNQSDKTDVKLEFRLGINMGDVVKKEGNLIGDGVNIAARLEALAQPNGITISKSVYDFVVPKTKMTFNDLGVQKVKQNEFHAFDILLDPSQKRTINTKAKLSLPVIGTMLAIFLMSAWGLLYYTVLSSDDAQFTSNNVISSKPIVLLSQIEVSGLSENQSFIGEGLTKYVASSLSKYKSIRLLPSTVSETASKASLNNKEILDQYRVKLLINPTLQGFGKNGRLTVEILDLEKNILLLSSTKTIDFTDPMKAQEVIGSQILSELQMKVMNQTAQLRKWLESGDNKMTPEMLRNLLNWRSEWRKFTFEGYVNSKALLEEAKITYKETRDYYAEEDFYVMEAWQIWLGLLLRINEPTPEILEDLNNKIQKSVELSPGPNTFSQRALVGFTLFGVDCEKSKEDVIKANEEVNTVDSLGIASIIYGRCGETKKAAEFARSALKILPIDINWHQTNVLAYRLLEDNQIDEIFNLVNENINAVDIPPSLLILFAFLEAKNGNDPLAKKYYSRAIETGWIKQRLPMIVYDKKILKELSEELEKIASSIN